MRDRVAVAARGLQRDDRAAFGRAIGSAHKIHLPADDADMPSARGFGIDLTRQIDLERAVDRDKPPEISEYHSVVRVGRRAQPDRGIAVGEAVEAARAHQHRANRDSRIDLFVPVVDHARGH